MAGPTYIYYATTPQGADKFNLTQPKILSNFQAIYELFPVNHINMNVADSFGKHSSTTMQIQDDPQGQPEEIIMYTKTSTGSNPAEIYIRYPDNTTNAIAQLSVPATPSSPSGTSGGTATQGYCSFPSGVVLRWGTYSVKGNSSYTLSSYTTGPSYKIRWYSAGITPTTSGCKIQVGASLQTTSTSSLTGFSSTFGGYTSTSVTTTFNYLMMGI